MRLSLPSSRIVVGLCVALDGVVAAGAGDAQFVAVEGVE
jgi:hypothetical protein